MPTFDAENEVHFLKQNRPFVSVARNGKLLPETMEVLNLIKKENIVLATGHSSAAENLLLVREGKKLGIAHIVVTHPLRAPTHMTIPEMQEAAKMGAYLELCGNAVLPTQPEDGRIPVEMYVKAIRGVGPDHIILSSDLGQKVNPVHTEGWKQYLDILRKAGISNADLDVMAKKNPAELLGLK
jgi:predicted metal-dependent phosphotriesterase family hydrolase